MFDVIIIGDGPAGVSASLYTTRANLKTLIIGNYQSVLKKAFKIENYYGFSEPVNGSFLLKEGIKQTKAIGTTVICDTVVSLSQDFEAAIPTYIVKTPSDTFVTNCVLIAIGQPSVKINIQGIKEFEGRGISYCSTCDGFFFNNKKIGVLGNKDFAVHEAIELKTYTDDITIYTNGLETDFSPYYQELLSNFKINKSKISSFNGDDAISSISFSDGTSENIDGVFIALDGTSGISFAKKIGLETDGRAIVTNNKQQTNLPGIFAAGDCTGGFKQIATAVGQGALSGRSMIEYMKEIKKGK